MRIFWSIILAIFSSVTIAEEENPYLSLTAPELRTRIAAVDELFSDQSWYQVEVIAFARKRPITGEYWRLDLQPEQDTRSAILPGSSASRLPEQADEIDIKAAEYGAWQWLDAEQLQLQSTVDSMLRDGNYRILLHGAWRQPMRERGRAFPIFVTGGEALAPMSRAPLATDPDQENTLSMTAPPPPLNPTVEYQVDNGEDIETVRLAPFSEPEFKALLRFHLARYLHVEPDAWLARESEQQQRYWVQIDQKRRMRGEELHYLDHPLFGLLLRLTPWQSPEQIELELLQEALRAQ